MLELTFGLMATISAVFGLAVITDVDVVHIDIRSVPPVMQAVGYDTQNVDTALLEELYLISSTAATARGVRFTALESVQTRSLQQFGNALGIGPLVQNTQDFFGMVPYRFRGHIIQQDDKLNFHLEMIETLVQRHKSAGELWISTRRDFISITAPVQDKQQLIHNMAEEIVKRIDPYLLALYYFRKELPSGKFTQSLSLLGDCVETLNNDETKWALLQIGRIHTINGDYTKAIEVFRLMEKKYPDFKFTQMRWGEVLAKQGKYADAAEKFLKAVQLDPNFVQVYAEWANMLERTGQIALADQLYTKALRILQTTADNAETADTRHGAALFYAKQRRYEEALPFAQAAVTKKPADQTYRATLHDIIQHVYPAAVVVATQASVAPTTTH